MESIITKKHLPQWLYISLAIFLIIIFVLAVFLFIFEQTYSRKIYPGIYLGQINLSGLNPETAKSLINQKVDHINQNGQPFIYKSQTFNLMPIVSSMESDLAYQIIVFDTDKTLSLAMSYGRNKNFLKNWLDKIRALTGIIKINMVYTAEEKEIEKNLALKFSSSETRAENAKLTYIKDAKSSIISFSVAPEKIGKKINYEEGIKNLKIKLASLDESAIILNDEDEYPEIYKKDCLNISAKAHELLSLAPIKLTYKDFKEEISADDFIGWLALQVKEDAPAEDKIIVGINNETVAGFLRIKIAPALNKAPVEPKFAMKEGRVEEFQIGQNGIELNIGSSSQKIAGELARKNNSIELAMDEIKSELSEQKNNLGIKEIIGTGHSNFSGSPKNRRHNIKVGANSLNGLLIKPDEEFSLVKALGEIEAKTGYLPELVIKDNKTTPEYGGGLCQIGTTMFRGALSSGLPITARRNHSYRVSYYEPAGTDATIYNPSPDFKFINDTKNYILIQSRFAGDNIYFDFWGTGDGRIATRTYPVIYNIKKPGPEKTIETLDLKPGEKKCTEKSHNGADAYFDYKVIYPDGEEKAKRFTSHYVPWRAVCLLGVEKLSTEKENIKSSTTAEKIVQ